LAASVARARAAAAAVMMLDDADTVEGIPILIFIYLPEYIMKAGLTVKQILIKYIIN
jgi:hypothetical protein